MSMSLPASVINLKRAGCQEGNLSRSDGNRTLIPAIIRSNSVKKILQ